MKLQQRSMISSEDIYVDLCNKIENLDYMPGDAISENELCEKYKTSRHMVRGAFSLLKQKQLLEVYPQRGSFVSLIDINYISDILYLRESIEQEALQRTIEADQVDSVVEKMTQNIKAQKHASRDNALSEEFYRLDAEFHGFILEAAEKKNIMALLADHFIHFRRWRNLELRSLMRVSELVKEHEEIMFNLKNRDSLGVRKSMHRHMDTIGLVNSVQEKAPNEYFYKR